MALVMLYLMTEDKIVRLERTIEFERVPCVGEWIRFEGGGLLPHRVTEITHDEAGRAKVVIGAQQQEDGRYLLLEDDEELRSEIEDQVKAGWVKMSETTNKLYRNKA